MPENRPWDVITFDCYSTLIDWEGRHQRRAPSGRPRPPTAWLIPTALRAVFEREPGQAAHCQTCSPDGHGDGVAAPGLDGQPQAPAFLPTVSALEAPSPIRTPRSSAPAAQADSASVNVDDACSPVRAGTSR